MNWNASCCEITEEIAERHNLDKEDIGLWLVVDPCGCLYIRINEEVARNLCNLLNRS